MYLQLFECVGEGREDRKGLEGEEGGRRDERSGEIMNELKVRLEEKAEEWKERERRIRREMGREEDEDEDDNDDEEVKEDEKKEEKMPSLPLDERSNDLQSQIASLIRRRKQGKEEIIGSDDSSSETE